MSDLNTSVADKGIFSRAIGVITAPGETYRAVIQSPRPAGILFIVCVVLALATGLPQFTEKGREATVNMQLQQIERSGREVTPQMRTQMETFSRYNGYITMVSIFVIVPVLSVVFSALYWGVFNTVLGGTATFKQVMGIVTHAQVIGALGAIISAPVMYMQGIASMAGPFNLGALVPMLEPTSAVYRVLTNVNFFTIWQTVVSAIGLGVLYRRKATPIAIFFVAVYLVVMAGVTLSISSFSQR